MTIRVYIASKLHHADKFKALRPQWRRVGIDLHSSWFDEAHRELNGQHVSPKEFGVSWANNAKDIRISDALIVYAEPEDTGLRGALVEAGIAIALFRPVYVIGDHNDYGTWHWHPLVRRADNLPHARRLILRKFRME